MEEQLRSILLRSSQETAHLEWEGRIGTWNAETQRFVPGVTEEQFKRIFTTLANQKDDWTAIEPFSLEIDQLYANGIRVRRRPESGTVLVTKKKLLGHWTYLIKNHNELAIRFTLNEEKEGGQYNDQHKQEEEGALERRKKRCRFHLPAWTYDVAYVQQQQREQQREEEGPVTYEIEVEFIKCLSLQNVQYAAQSLQYRMNSILPLFLSSSPPIYHLVSTTITTITAEKQPQRQEPQRQEQTAPKRVWHICR